MELKKKYSLARVERVLQASPLRVVPDCPHYGLCGGCDLMHLEHAAQVEAKQGWAKEALARVTNDDIWGKPVASSPWGYRNRVRWQVKNGRLGFYQRGSRRLLPIEQCPVLHPALQDLLGPLTGALTHMPAPGPEQLEGLAGEDGPVFLTARFGGGAARAQAVAWQREALALPGVAGVRLVRGRTSEPWPLGPDSAAPVIAPDGVSLFAAPGLFSQVNFRVNAGLLQLLGNIAGQGDGRRALDLYSGWGNLGLILAQSGWQVRAVENAPGCGKAAAHLAGLNRVADRLDFVSREAGDYLRRASRAGERFDLVVLDPPRTGAKGLMPHLAALGAGRVVYVSCHLAALARDAGELAKQGYRPVEARVLDMFPQTSQVETLLVLDRA